jgi:hypothetical protein
MCLFSNNVVPIVLGAHPDDYRAVAPEKSYIHVEDFENPSALTKYLQYLDQHDEEYNKYFEWRETGQFIDHKFFCRICGMTHYADLIPPPEREEAFVWEEVEKHRLCLPVGKSYWKF